MSDQVKHGTPPAADPAQTQAVQQVQRQQAYVSARNLRLLQKKPLVSTGRSLDLAIVTGDGFFPLQDPNFGRLFSRVGQFAPNKDNVLTDNFGRELIGFLTDAENNITGAMGPLRVSTEEMPPKATEVVQATINFDSRETPPPAPFIDGFTPDNPPATTTYNRSSRITVFDSLGNQHLITLYYVKKPAERTWRVYVGMNGVDVTPAASAAPAEGTPAEPVAFAAHQTASPFTVVFDNFGRYVQHNRDFRTQYFGLPPVLSYGLTTTTLQSGALTRLGIGDLTINGIPISVGLLAEHSSTTDNIASAITLRDAINASHALHKVYATTTGTIFDFTGGNYTIDPLAAEDLNINGIDIIGVPAAATVDAYVDLINNMNGVGISGVVASNNGGQLRLSAADGRNIQIASSGNAISLDFTNFASAGQARIDRVKRGQLSLTTGNNNAITIGGNHPDHAGFTMGTKAGIFQTNSDDIEFTFNPATGAASPQRISLDLQLSTQFAAPFSITDLTQNGYPTGSLTGMRVTADGIILGQFSNGMSQQLGQISLVSFRDTRGLEEMPNFGWAETAASGVALHGSPGTDNFGTIASGYLEVLDDSDLFKATEQQQARQQQHLTFVPRVLSEGAEDDTSRAIDRLAREFAANVIAAADRVRQGQRSEAGAAASAHVARAQPALVFSAGASAADRTLPRLADVAEAAAEPWQQVDASAGAAAVAGGAPGAKLKA